MDDAAHPAGWFVGDLDDPWVASIADVLPAGFRRLRVVGDLPERWPDPPPGDPVLVLHRPTLSVGDHECLRRIRRAGLFSRVILCVGPHARYAQVQRCSDIVDVILPEATAAECLRRHLSTSPAPFGTHASSEPVLIVGAVHELAQWLADTCSVAGYCPVRVRGWEEAPEVRLAVWDVPMLESSWASRLAVESRRRAIIAMLGMADRESVRLARSSGAAACLDLPCEPEDLAFALDRLAVETLPDEAPGARRAILDPSGAGSTPHVVVGRHRSPYNATSRRRSPT